jgi:hypothetical protein
LHLLLDGSSGAGFLFDKLVDTGEAVSLDSGPENPADGDKSGLNILLPAEISEPFSFKENVTDDDLREISAAIVKLQLKLGVHLRTKSGIMKLQLKVNEQKNS